MKSNYSVIRYMIMLFRFRTNTSGCERDIVESGWNLAFSHMGHLKIFVPDTFSHTPPPHQ